MSYLDDTVNALNIKLNDEDIKYLEELYVPHPINGTIVNNWFIFVKELSYFYEHVHKEEING